MMKVICAVVCTLTVGAYANSADPCNPSSGDYAAGYKTAPPGFDSWRFTWDNGIAGRMNAYRCRDSCETCTTEGLPPFKENCQYPNGFRTAQVHMDNEPPFCLTVADAGDSMVQVLIETEMDNHRLCVESIGSSVLLNDGVTTPPQCGEGQINACFPGENSNNLNLMVYCDASCPESNTVFKYKVMHSNARSRYDQDNAAIANIDMWCSMQDGIPATWWPSDLLPSEPENMVYQDKSLQGGASSASSSLAVLTALMAAAFAFAR